MIWFNMKTCPLLWGVSILLSVGAMGSPITNTTGMSSTVKADQMATALTTAPTTVPATAPATALTTALTTAPPIALTTESATAHVHHHEPEKTSGPTHKPAEVTATPHMTTEVITNTQVQLLHTSTVPESKATASDQPTPSGTRTGMVQSTEVQPHPQSPTTSTAVTPPETASTTLPTTAALGTISPTTGTISPTITTASPTSASSSLGRSTMGTTTSELFSTATPGSSPEVPSLTHKPSSPSVSENSSVMVSATTGSSPVLNHTSSFPESRTEMPTTTTTTSGTPPPPSTHKPISATTPYMSTSAFPDTTKLQPPAESSSTKVSTSTTMASNHSGGILIPVSPRKLPVPTSKSVTPVTKITESPPTTQVQSCSVRHIIKQCLIAVAVLAALATIFMVSTIILCTKLSARKYRVKKPQQATEMMCISALLPERNHNYTRQRNPVTNGVLVIPSGADSDDDGGDNLTLSSFLPDNDRFV